jgi:hypothetical protein
VKAPFQPRRRGRQELSPEDFKRQRRDRRTQRASQLEPQVRAWAEQHGCSLRVLNDGQHWLFQKPGFMAEWWPSSAKLVVNRDYTHDHHAPHWTELVAVMQQHLAASRIPTTSALL